MSHTYVYYVLSRQRSKSLSALISEAHQHPYDRMRVQFISLDLNKAREFYDTFKPYQNIELIPMAKYLVKAPLDQKLEIGVNDEYLSGVEYNKIS